MNRNIRKAFFLSIAILTFSSHFAGVAHAAPLTNGMNAANVLGHVNFTSGSWATTESALNMPQASVYDATNDRLFVADTANNRVLVYAGSTFTNGQAAINVLGQPGFTTSVGSYSQSGMAAPSGIAYDATNQRLFVVDNSNSRVLVYNVATITNGQAAVNVLGQSDFTSRESGTTQSRMYYPTDVAYDATNHRLFVVDQSNQRVLVFNVLEAITNGEAAVNVLGQTSFTSIPPQENHTQSGLSNPSGISYDTTNQRLFVAEAGNSRVIVYDVATITNGENAVNVLGQADFTSHVHTTTTQSSTDGPQGVAYDATNERLFVADSVNNRVLVYDVESITNGEAAVNVLGQMNFTEPRANMDDSTNQSGMEDPRRVAYDATSQRLFVSELGNNRVLIYDLSTAVAPDITPPAAVTDLALSGPTTSSLVLTWTAPGDDGSVGTATLYDIRYSISPIASAADFTAAAQVSGEPVPAVVGHNEAMTVSGLSADTTYYFAMKTRDEVPNDSAISNNPSLTTAAVPDDTPDTTPPTLAPVTLASTHSGNPSIATNGDMVQVTFTSNEPLSWFAVNWTIGGRPAVLPGGNSHVGNTWTANLHVKAEDGNGPVGFTIAYEDMALNAGTIVSSTTDGSSVVVQNPLSVVGPNLIVNPSVETAGTGGNPLSWLRGGFGTNTRVYTYPMAGQDGAKAVKVDVTAYASGNAKWYFADVPVTPGKTYVFSDYFKSNVPSAVVIQYKMTNGTFTYGTALLSAASASSWSQVQRTFTVPANVKSLTVFHSIAQIGFLTTDNFSLRLVGNVDTTQPDVAISTPANGAVVVGIVTVAATATDNVGVAGVTFILDGQEVAEDTAAPYSLQWNTLTWNTLAIENGMHALTARARDAAGNTRTSAPVTVTVNNPVAAGPNLIANPSLETAGTGGNPSKWLRGGYGTNTASLTYPVAGQDGAKAARVDITAYVNGNAKWFFNEVPVTPGKSYSFSDYFKSSVPSAVVVRFKMTNGTFTYGTGSTSSASPSGWSIAQRTFLVPANVVSLTVFHSIAQVGYLTTDNFSLRQVITPAPNLIVNPSLETAGSDGNPSKWLRGGFGNNTAVLSYPVAGQDGAKAAKVDITAFVSGNAKWYFHDVPVIPGKTYAISDYYKSNVPSSRVSRFKMTNGTFTYGSASVRAASPDSWSQAQGTITIPANATSLTVFHSIAEVGYLTTDNFSLTLLNP